MNAREFTAPSVMATIAAWAGFVTGPNTMISSVSGLFMKPMAAEFHLNRTEISSFSLIIIVIVAIGVPFAGRLIDRWGIRRVVIPAVVVFALSQLLVSGVQNTLELVGAYALVGMAAVFQSSVGYAKLVTVWFSRWRGLMLGLVVALGSGGGSVVMPQVVRALINHYGWRGGYVGLGVIILVIALPITYFFLREPAKPNAQRQETPQAGLTRGEAMRKPTFWILFSAIFLASMSLLGTLVHAYPMFTERGFTPQTATTALSLLFLGSIVGQLSSGFLVDRFDSSRAAVPYFGSALIGLMIEHTTSNATTLYVGAVMHGLGQGGEIALAAYFTSRYFGLRHFGAIYSLFFAVSNVGIGVGLISMGVCHDAVGSYLPMRLVFGPAMFVSFCLMGMLGPYRFTKHGIPINAYEAEKATA